MVVNNTVYQFLSSNQGVEIFLKKRKHQKKGALKSKIEASLYTFYWGFKKIAFKLYTYVLANTTKRCKVYTKTDSWFQKWHEEFGQLQTCSGKSKQLKFDGLLLSKKYISSAKTLYTDDLFDFSCHFWNHKSFFTTQLPCIF